MKFVPNSVGMQSMRLCASRRTPQVRLVGVLAQEIGEQTKVIAESLQLPDFLREIFGNPFRWTLIDPGWLAWNDGTVPKLAHAIYDERAFDRMPILADALEDAGCNDADILRHCREPGEHVRGCWVIDLLLGKE